MFCTNCGQQVPDDTRFCPYCGEHVANAGRVANAERIESAEATAAQAAEASAAQTAGSRAERAADASPDALSRSVDDVARIVVRIQRGDAAAFSFSCARAGSDCMDSCAAQYAGE